MKVITHKVGPFKACFGGFLGPFVIDGAYHPKVCRGFVDSGIVTLLYKDNNVYNFICISEISLVTARYSEVVGGRGQRRDAWVDV